MSRSFRKSVCRSSACAVRTPRLAVWLILLGLCLPAAANDTQSLTIEDEAAVRQLTKDYFDAYAAEDMPRWEALWATDSPHFAERREFQQQLYDEAGEIQLKRLRITAVAWDAAAEVASVTLNVHLTGIFVKTGDPYGRFGSGPLTRVLEFKRDTTGWRVWQYADPATATEETVAEVEASIRDFYAAYITHDRQQLESLLWLDSVGAEDILARWEKMWSNDATYRLDEITFGRARHEDDRSVVSVSVQVKVATLSPEGGEPTDVGGDARVVYLQRRDGRWGVLDARSPYFSDVKQMAQLRTKRERDHLLPFVVRGNFDLSVEERDTPEETERYRQEIETNLQETTLVMAYAWVENADHRRQFLLEEPRLVKRPDFYGLTVLLKFATDPGLSLNRRLQFVRAAEEIALHSGEAYWMLCCRVYKALVLEEAGQPAQALATLDQAYQLLNTVVIEGELEIPNLAAWCFALQVRRARLLVQFNKPEQAALAIEEGRKRFYKNAVKANPTGGWGKLIAFQMTSTLKEAENVIRSEETAIGEGRFEEALGLAQQELDLERSVYGPIHSEHVHSYQKLALIQCYLGQFDAARASLLAAREILEFLYPKNAEAMQQVVWRSEYVDQVAGLPPEQQARLRQAYQQEMTIIDDPVAKRNRWQSVYDTYVEILGPKHYLVGDSCQQLAIRAMLDGQPVEGSRLFRQTVEILGGVLGQQSSRLRAIYATWAEALRRRAVDDFDALRFSQGHDIQAELVVLYRERLGADAGQTRVAEALLNAFDRALALSPDQQERLKQARQSIGDVVKHETSLAQATDQQAQVEQALADVEELVGRDNPIYVLGQSTLGLVFIRREQPEAAERIWSAAYASPYAVSKEYAAWAVPYYTSTMIYNQGRFAEAERRLANAIPLMRESLGVQDVRYWEALRRHAMCLLALQLRDEAQVQYVELFYCMNRVLLPSGHENAIRNQPVTDFAEIDAESDPRFDYYGRALIQLSKLLHAQKRSSFAQDCIEAAGNLFLRLHGSDSAEAKVARYYLAETLRLRGNRERAIELFTELIAQTEAPETLTQTELTFLTYYHRELGDCFAGLDRDDDAVESYTRAYELQQSLGEPASDVYNAAIYKYVVVTMGREDFDTSLTLARQYAEWERAKVTNVRLFGSEQEVRAMLLKYRDGLELLWDLAVTAPEAQRQPFIDAALEWTLQTHALATDTICRMRLRTQLMQSDPAVAELAAKLRERRQQASNLVLNPPAGLLPSELHAQMKAIESEAAQLEAQLNAALSQLDGGEQLDEPIAVTTEAVRQALPPGTSLVMYVNFKPANYIEMTIHQYTYYAFVIPADSTQAVRFIEIGDAAAVNRDVAAYRERIVEDLQAYRQTPTDRLTLAEADWEAELMTPSRGLYDRLIAPVLDIAGATDTLLIVPEGQLNRLPFEALVNEQQQYLVETHRIAYLTSGRDLLRPESPLGSGTAVFAAADFDLAGEELADSRTKLLKDLPEEPLLALRGDGPGELRGLRWGVLEATETEAKEIEKLLGDTEFGPVTSFLGLQALEEVVKRLPAPRILHIATHGFFLPNQSSGAGTSIQVSDDVEVGQARGFARLKTSDNPLLRSGLVLSGANAVGGQQDADDGWLTAQEIALLDLHGTDLVVLSACESGLGAVETGEGVQGLRVAFQYAGARTLISTLFQIPDRETGQLMKGFYTRLKSGESKLNALQGAQREVIRQHREANQAAHPLFWASFVLVGETE